jgi:glycosyltransferase involved in cell wall biosynthesis
VIKVSVVVPVYNPGRYLHRCAESVLDQTLPVDEREVVFVDDGSTDGSPSYLDGLAADHPHVRVIHQENSGWPGGPRNVGLAAARGVYVFFCDADDWLAPDALADLYAFAAANSSDVVLPKMAGVRRPVPHHVFTKTVGATSLADGPLMESLTAHKLFRRAFLEEHGIRFPEGRRRLEDHHFVVTAYLLAKVVSIYAEHTCYTHVRREDEGNLTSGAVDWEGYFTNLAEAVGVVEHHTEPGPFRDRVLRRWLQTEMVARLSGQRYLDLAPDEATQLFRAASRVAAQHFGPGVVELLAPVLRPVARALRSGDEERVRRQAESVAAWRTRAELLQAAWDGPVLRLSGGLAQHENRRGAEAADPPEVRFLALFDAGVDPEVVALGRRTLALTLTEPSRGEQWRVPARLHGGGLQGTFTADVDLRTAAAGAPLGLGTWELSAHFTVLGLGSRVRVRVVKERMSSLRGARSSLPETEARVLQTDRAVSLHVARRENAPVRWVRRVHGAVRWRTRRVLRRVRAVGLGR